jgi:hypothetical protein
MDFASLRADIENPNRNIDDPGSPWHWKQGNEFEILIRAKAALKDLTHSDPQQARTLHTLLQKTYYELKAKKHSAAVPLGVLTGDIKKSTFGQRMKRTLAAITLGVITLSPSAPYKQPELTPREVVRALLDTNLPAWQEELITSLHYGTTNQLTDALLHAVTSSQEPADMELIREFIWAKALTPELYKELLAPLTEEQKEVLDILAWKIQLTPEHVRIIRGAHMTEEQAEQIRLIPAQYLTPEFLPQLLQLSKDRDILIYRVEKKHLLDEELLRLILALPEPVVKQLLNAEVDEITAHTLQRILENPAALALLRDSPSPNPAGIGKDPELYGMEQIQDNWLFTIPADHAQLINLKAMIARNLNLTHQDINAQTVGQEHLRILQSQTAYRKIPLFANRDVVLVANGEKWEHDARDPRWLSQFIRMSGSESRFGTPALQAAIRKQARTLNIWRFEESSEQKKQELLDYIIHHEGPLTLFFDAHGFERGIGLTKTQDLLEYELRDALIKRWKTIHLDRSNIENHDIIIVSTCYSGTIGQKIVRALPELGPATPVPFILGPTEYGQIGRTDRTTPFGTRFTTRLIEGGKRPTIGDAIRLDKIDQLHGNPTIYAPGPENKPMQLASMDHRAA